MNCYQRALQLQEETIAHRRFFHTHAEVGLEMPKACDYVTKTLSALELTPRPCGKGITATLGSGGKTILLRADMDALPMAEESGEPFACPTGKQAHTCGHDLHAAMLLTAAKILKEQESKLEGTVKFMFQPAEEPLEGARNMIEAGILEDPKVDAALACHVTSGHAPVGTILYNDTGTMMHSADGFEITIRGKSGHGAYPQMAIDPINIAVHVYLALDAIVNREVSSEKSCVLTFGSIHAGTAYNIIPDIATLEGTLRTNHPESRTHMLKRIEEAVCQTAALYDGTGDIRFFSNNPPLICNPALTREIVGYLKELEIPNISTIPGITASASEDFAAVTERVPGSFLYLSAGFPNHQGDAPAHNSKVRFNENVLPIGAGGLAHCALRWLAEHK